MNIIREYAIDLIKQQIKDQGCEGDSLADIRLMQPHLFSWIDLFGFTKEDLE